MTHQIDLQEAWPLLIPFAESTQRDLMLEQSAGPGVRPPFELILLSLPAQQTIDGGRAHPPQLLPGLSFTLELTAPIEQLHHLPKHRRQTFAADVIHNPPYLNQHLHYLLIVVRSPPGPAQFLTHITTHAQLGLHRYYPTVIAQHHRRVTPRELGQLHKLVQDCRLLFLPRPPIPPCRGLHDVLSLFHR